MGVLVMLIFVAFGDPTPLLTKSLWSERICSSSMSKLPWRQGAGVLPQSSSLGPRPRFRIGIRNPVFG